jgi:serine/threonine protein phosphatase PrpC
MTSRPSSQQSFQGSEPALGYGGHMHVASRTEVGYVRRRNEDSLLVEESIGVVAVADGLGGHPCGDLASQTAVASLRDSLAGGHDDGADTGAWLIRALLVAHRAVLAEAGDDPDREGMATTVVLAVVDGGQATIAHVGDSRAYLLADGALQALTRDHGIGGYITQALGLDRVVDPDVGHFDLSAGDRLLLCTDGLTNMVDDKGIALLLGKGDPTEATDALVEAALANGGIDNITVIVVQA